MTGRGIDQILRCPVDPRLYENYVKDARKYVSYAEEVNGKISREVEDDYIWGDALAIWKKRNPDLKIINLETAITTNETYFPKGINYRMHPENVSVLSSAEIDICSLANNHILDWDYQGMIDTIAALDGKHIKHSGAGKNLEYATAPAIVENQAGRILVFSIGYISSGMPVDWSATEHRGGVFLLESLNSDALKRVSALIEKHREKDDTVIVSIHWGDNWGYQVDASNIKFAHALIDYAGVNIIHGHSSHHPRPIEIYKGCPILYGCGDFINDYEGIRNYEEFHPELCNMYFISFEMKPFKFLRLELDCLKMKRFRLIQASVSELNWMHETLNRICMPFSLCFELSIENTLFVKGVH